ncbi:MAG: UDP-N-acetylmuramoyl-L-alanyl-D-glutamate--2,6-diaminopimelate ligase [Saprospiraceae bacterium]
MKRLEDILKNVATVNINGNTEKSVSEIIFDSRKAKTSSLFVAVRGTQVDGHDFLESAIQKGSDMIVCETLPEILNETVTYIQVADSAAALGQMASNFYEHPSTKLKLIGVTGTNGKTTTVTLLYRLFSDLGYKVGLLSTVENIIAGQVIPSTYTTPDAVQINALIEEMVDSGCEYAFMEVSSHAIQQHRITGLTFTGGLFTNISHDHLDYHKTFKAYIKAKKMFFDILESSAFALTNIDDRNGLVMLQNTKARKLTYGLRRPADFKAKIIENSLSGLYLELDKQELFARLIGQFNAYNLLSVYSVAVLLEQEKFEVLQSLSKLKSAEGRFDYVLSKDQKITAIVDYAHTPDALEKVLSTIDKLKSGNTKVITVVGCGGDRDKKKRPLMAKVACDYSHQVILTSDNPRSEEPEAILQDMEAGIPPYATQKSITIINRKEAIKVACKLAQPEDIILVAGKGHEKYQEIKGVKHDFDDKKILREFLG